MNTLELIRPHSGKLFRLAVSMGRPGNAAVVVMNMLSLMRGQPWLDYVGRHSKHGLTYDVLIERSLSWLCHSQDVVGSGGVGCYEFFRWTPGYPEVTGYIIPTLWDCHAVVGHAHLAERAIRMADWELGVQKPEGGYEGGYEGDGQPMVVFNTGQVIRGLLRTYRETRDERYMIGAIRAGDWITSVQESDGSWAKHNYKGMERVYDTYVSAALAQLYHTTQEQKYAEAAERNCRFALDHQRTNAWFEMCDNTVINNSAPVTHTICYTVDGLIETGELLDIPEFVDAARRTADALMHQAEIRPRFYGRFDEDWTPRVRFVALTGAAQLGIVLMRLYDRSGDPRYLNASLKLVDFLAYVQRLNSHGRDRFGGMPGAYPIWGMYVPFKYPSWAVKYFIDLLLRVRDVGGDGPQ